MAQALLEPDIIVSKNPIDDVIPSQPMILGAGVDSANQRIGIKKPLVETPGAKARAIMTVNNLFDENNINVVDNNINGNPIKTSKLQEHFAYAINKGLIDKNSDLGSTPTGCLRVPNVDDGFGYKPDMSNTEQELIPSLVKTARKFAEEAEDKLLNRHQEYHYEHPKGPGMMNDAIVRAHLQNDEPRINNNKVVDSLLNDYIKKNPAPKIKYEEDIPLNEIAGNSTVVSVQPSQHIRIRNNGIIVILIALMSFMLIFMILGVISKSNFMCRLFGFCNNNNDNVNKVNNNINDSNINDSNINDNNDSNINDNINDNNV